MSSPDTADEACRHPRERGSTELYLEHAQYYIIHVDAHLPGPDPAEVYYDKLLQPAPDGDEDGGIFVRTGTMVGPIVITVETYDSVDEAVPDNGEWEIRQEVGVIAKGRNLCILAEPGVEVELPQLDLAPGEAAGIRLHARGVMEAAAIQELTGPDDRAIEHHLLQLWRA